MVKIIIINGNGGIGKDTLIKSLNGKFGEVKNFSAITPIVEMVEQNKRIIKKYANIDVDSVQVYTDHGKVESVPRGKDEAYRELLSDVKSAYVKFCDIGRKYLSRVVLDAMFFSASDTVCFLHIREPEEIAKMVADIKSVYAEGSYVLKTMLVTRDTGKKWNNKSDDNVANYDYDIVFDNNKPIKVACEEFYNLIRSL